MGFLINIVIVIAIIWLTQVLLSTFEIAQPANKIIFVVVVLLAVLWLATGSFLPIR